MVYKNNNELKLAQENITYTRDTEQFTQPIVEGREWWIDFESKHEDMKIVEFKAIEYNNEQKARFEEVKGMDISESVLNDYVMENKVGEGLEVLALKKENASLQTLIAGLIGGAL
jgi:hypothetical protein